MDAVSTGQVIPTERSVTSALSPKWFFALCCEDRMRGYLRVAAEQEAMGPSRRALIGGPCRTRIRDARVKSLESASTGLFSRGG